MVSIKDKEFWISFIEKYRSFPCLWDVFSSDYKNKILRDEAMKSIVDHSKEINPEADQIWVRHRISNMRTAFSREFKKIKNSQGTGKAAGDIYTTNLWYYNYLLFLKDGETPRDGMSTLQDSSSLQNISDEEDLFSRAETPNCTNRTHSRPDSACSSHRSKQSTLAQQQKTFFQKASEFLSLPRTEVAEDEFDILGKRVAAHFRGMCPDQRLFAEKLISDIMIKGRLNLLSASSTFNAAPPTDNTNSVRQCAPMDLACTRQYIYVGTTEAEGPLQLQPEQIQSETNTQQNALQLPNPAHKIYTEISPFVNFK